MNIPFIASLVAVIALTLGAIFYSRESESPATQPVEVPVEEKLGADKTAYDEIMFAHVTPEGIIDNIIVADQAFIDSGMVGNPAEWVLTDYKDPDKAAEIGGSYDWQKQKFINKVETKIKKSADEKEPKPTATTT